MKTLPEDEFTPEELDEKEAHRELIARELPKFLAAGGVIEKVPTGLTAAGWKRYCQSQNLI